MSSWRVHIGKVSPSRGDTYVYEFYRMVPENILLTLIATTVKSLTPDNFTRAFSAYEEAALTLVDEGVETLIFGGGPVFLSQGAQVERDFCSRLQKATSLSVTTEFLSAVEACHALGIKRLGIISPFKEALNSLVKSYFEEKGFQVPLIRGLGIERNIDIANLPEDAASNLTREAFREGPGVDGFYITCPRWRTASSIAVLEKETGKPVVTTVQSTVWSAFKALGIKDKIVGYGALLS